MPPFVLWPYLAFCSVSCFRFSLSRSRQKSKSNYQETITPPVRQRADALLVAKGHAASRDRAQAMITAGYVRVNGQPLVKASKTLDPTSIFEIAEGDLAWVSRGALKLVGGLDAFASQIDPRGRYCVDIGASTGGFTEVLLARGAAHVSAVDVGHGQLHARIAADPQVQVCDGINARYLVAANLRYVPDLVVCDASFISLTKVLPAVLDLAAPGAYLLALIKPQFEVGRGRVGKGGIVRDPALHDETIAMIEGWLTDEMGWTHLGTVPSPIDGPDGNREFLIAGVKPADKLD